MHRKGRYFYTRKHADKEKTIVYWKQGENGAEKVLFDPNTWSDRRQQGPRRLVAEPGRQVRRVRGEGEQLRRDRRRSVIDVATGKDLHRRRSRAPSTRGASWTPDGKGFYYTWVPPVGGKVPIAERPGFAEVRFHELGTDPAKDPVVHPRDRRTRRRSSAAASRATATGCSSRSSTAGTRPTSTSRTRASRTRRGRRSSTGVDATFTRRRLARPVLRARRTTARRATACSRSIRSSPSARRWKEIVPQSDATLESVDVVGEHLVADLPAQRRERDRGPRPRRQAGAQGRAAAARHRRAASAATPTRTPATSRTRRSPSRRSSTRRRSRPARSTEWARIKLPIDTVAARRPSRSSTRRRTAPRSRCSSSTRRARRRTARTRRSSTATAASTSA